LNSISINGNSSPLSDVTLVRRSIGASWFRVKASSEYPKALLGFGFDRGSGFVIIDGSSGTGTKLVHWWPVLDANLQSGTLFIPGITEGANC
jgi:hypothetical protein